MERYSAQLLVNGRHRLNVSELMGAGPRSGNRREDLWMFPFWIDSPEEVGYL